MGFVANLGKNENFKLSSFGAVGKGLLTCTKGFGIYPVKCRLKGVCAGLLYQESKREDHIHSPERYLGYIEGSILKGYLRGGGIFGTGERYGLCETFEFECVLCHLLLVTWTDFS